MLDVNTANPKPYVKPPRQMTTIIAILYKVRFAMTGIVGD